MFLNLHSPTLVFKDLNFLPSPSPTFCQNVHYFKSNDVQDTLPSVPCSSMSVNQYRNFDLYEDKSFHLDHLVTCQKCWLAHQCKVQCLESIESLRKKYIESNVKLNDYVELSFSYEVDMILDHKVDQGQTYYFVKWKNYTSDCNTWEPEIYLSGCKKNIEFYHAMKSSQVVLNKNIISKFVRDLTSRKPYDTLSLIKMCALCSNSTESYVNSLHLNVSQMKDNVRKILNFSQRRLTKISENLFSIMQFAEERKRVLLSVKEWEININKQNQSTYILVENNVDLEPAPPPSSFQFIHDYIYTSVQIPEEPVAFCHCENCFDNRESCCPKDSEGHFAYSRHKRLILPPGYPIYECNKLCKCSSDCANRVVQHGQKIKVCIFRTSNGCGWGLRTLEPIEKDQFVLEYLGEVVTSEVAEIRGQIYDYSGRSYLFDLDYGVESCCFTVDAGHLGNAAHFINHSCDPNLHVFAVWINQPDPRLPRLAFFAKRKIRRGEELTFDYKMIQKYRYDTSSDLPSVKRVLCLCNSKNCKKYLF